MAENIFKEPDKVKVFLDKGGDRGSAEKLGREIGIEVTEDPTVAENADILLRYAKNGLSFESDGLVLHGDLSTMLHRIEKGRLDHEMLVKAAKLKDVPEPLYAVDATAGMGEDSLLLAAAGYNVTLFERDPIIAALLKDSVRRATRMPGISEYAKRMTVINGDSIELMGSLPNTPDLIYLDPMFPAKTNSALVKKKFQMIYLLETQSHDESDLLSAATAAGPRKIVIKRPAKGPFLGGVKPGYSLPGKAIRYDMIIIPR